MTDFNKGWWNCFESFAYELLLYHKGQANSDGHLISVLREAGVTPNEIREYLRSDYPRDNVQQWLENYLYMYQ